MSHTPFAQSRLAEAQRLKRQASELDRGIDRRHGAFGYEAGSEGESLREQARQIEASVLIPFQHIPNFNFHVRDCSAALNAAERIRVLAGVGPRMRVALEEIAAMGKPGSYDSCSLWPPKPTNHSCNT